MRPEDQINRFTLHQSPLAKKIKSLKYVRGDRDKISKNLKDRLHEDSSGPNQNQFIADIYKIQLKRIPSSKAIFTKIPRTMHPNQKLSVPGIRNDFYLSLMDWKEGLPIVLGLGSELWCWQKSIGETFKLLTTESPISSVRWMGFGCSVVCGLDNGEICCFDVSSLKEKFLHKQGNDRISTIAPHPQSTNLTSTGSKDKSITCIDTRDPKISWQIKEAHGGEVCGLSYSPSKGYLLASGGNDNQLVVWDTRMQSGALYEFNEHIAAVRAIAWSPTNSDHLLSGGGTADKSLKLWSLNYQDYSSEGQTSSIPSIASIQTGSQICDLHWNQNGDLISAHGYSDNYSLYWPSFLKSNLKEDDFDDREYLVMRGHGDRVLGLATDGSNVVSVDGEGIMCTWDNLWNSPKYQNGSCKKNKNRMAINGFDL